jgi:hypothetical protein
MQLPGLGACARSNGAFGGRRTQETHRDWLTAVALKLDPSRWPWLGLPQQGEQELPQGRIQPGDVATKLVCYLNMPSSPRRPAEALAHR